MNSAREFTPLRVLHVVDTLGQGGLENGLVNLIQQLDADEFEHVVCTMRGMGENLNRLPADRVQVMCLAAAPGRRFAVPALMRVIRQVKPDVVHSRNWGSIEAVVAGRLAGSCAVVHGEHGHESDGAAGEPWRRVAFRRLAFELADRVLAVSCQLRDHHARRTGFRADRITVIHNGVDTRRFSPDEAVRVGVRRQLGLADNALCIGCVGNLLPVKSHITLLRALEVVAGGRPNWRLVLLGEGSERHNLEEFVRSRAGWDSRVLCLGSSKQVPEMLNAMDVYVLPSVNEGISNSLLEAMATGLPVIASAVGGNPEVVVDDDCGLLFPARDHVRLADQLLTLWNDPERRRELGLRARQRIATHFSLASMTQQYRQTYQSLRMAAGVGAMARA
jgi:sugar transferase (PEP-CTERM/EpsH1 system associated)